MLVKLKEVIHPAALARICEKLELNPDALLEPQGSTKVAVITSRLPHFEYRICGTNNKLIISRDHCGAQLFRWAYSN